MTDTTDLHARQATYVKQDNLKVRAAAAVARNKVAWAALYASNPDPEALCYTAPEKLAPRQPWPATAAGSAK
jgi:hypothetical protein